jgi:hypothetical protein
VVQKRKVVPKLNIAKTNSHNRANSNTTINSATTKDSAKIKNDKNSPDKLTVKAS